MIRSRCPSDLVVSVELNPCVSIVIAQPLKAIVVDEHVSRPPLQLVS